MGTTILLNANSKSIKYLSKKDSHLKDLFNLIGELSYTLYTDSYKFLVDTIIGQMLSNKVADIISNRLLNLCNGNVTPQEINSLSNLDLRNIGISNSKINYIMNLTNSVLNDEISFESFANKPNIEIEKELQKIKGIGKWSSKMYLIFCFRKEDILPYENIAFIQGYSWLYNTTKVDKNP